MNGWKKKAVKGLLGVVLAGIAGYTLFPLYFMFVNSFKGQSEIVGNPLGMPQSWDLSYIRNAIEQINLLQALMYTLLGTVASLFLLVTVSALAAWVMVRSKSKLSQVFFRIVFPLVKSTTVTVIILNTMWIWNDYLLPFLVIGNTKTKTLTLELFYARSLAGQYGNPWELVIPAVMVSSIPVILLFLALQKHFISGVSDGAVKS
ncbi:carbohydrate ABC transporter permease [Anaerotalea alkaliphila]|uniref:Carbohydrate ABC transporter permease n=1 Tax=Anaerotalea alkaliphila TaxID=2662126 RepID=A0A7X5HTP6_9FIRM|nr:carbohydrate ABC transporter permease [Anaerotalea alkaliphila]NDL66473.1 carbohydrate ABC transporter permease [Anaerotalea alkaliphila]